MDRAENFIVPPPGLLPPARPSAEDDEPKHRGDTTEPFPKFVARIPGAPPVATPQPDAKPAAVSGDSATRAPASWRLILPDGSFLDLDQPVLVGRNPAAATSAPDARLVAVADPAKSLSKTHALLTAVEHGIAVTDLYSTNGVVITTSGGEPVALEPDVPATAPDGASIELGTVLLRVQRIDS